MGFGAFHETEALPGTLPPFGNTPQKCSHGLYAEQINGTAFTKAKHANLRTWWYRIRPSAPHKKYAPYKGCKIQMKTDVINPERIRWDPFPMPSGEVDFVHGLTPYAGAGDPSLKAGLKIYLYSCNTSMKNSSYCSSDGDMLFVPEHGTLNITTECGKMEVPSGFICVIPRGIRFQVDVAPSGARGYVCETYDQHFELPPAWCDRLQWACE